MISTTTYPSTSSRQTKRLIHLTHLRDALRAVAYHASLAHYESESVRQRARMAAIALQADTRIRQLLAKQNLEIGSQPQKKARKP